MLRHFIYSNSIYSDKKLKYIAEESFQFMTLNINHNCSEVSMLLKLLMTVLTIYSKAMEMLKMEILVIINFSSSEFSFLCLWYQLSISAIIDENFKFLP